MGDRNNPIKFGPEWLRNLPREQAASRTNNTSMPSTARPTGSSRPGGSVSSAASSQTSGSASSPPTRSIGATQRPRGAGSGSNPGSGGSMGPTGASGTSGTSGINTRNSNTNVSRVLLASLRYGREEMLALYDGNAEAPDDLKHFDILYQPRGKPPAALNNYEEDTRDNGRGGPPIGTSGERFGMGRGLGRGTNNEVRMNKMRAPFTRHSPAGRGISMTGGPRLPMYSGGDEEPTTSRAWSASNGAAGQSRTPTEQTDWSKMFRRRQTNNTNWRQQTARDEEEWRQDSPRAGNRSNADKWERDWGDRPVQDRPQGWNANRRSRVGDQNEDNLPEWAIDNTEGGGAGTFDSSGAFHGCSNDDSNLPRTQEPAFALTRSHTHGSFAPRKLSIEEGSDEWWASEKAKKLSPKRFEAGDARFKRSQSASANESISSSSQNEDQLENPDKGKNVCENSNSETNINKHTYSDTQTFDALMRSEMREEFNDTSEDQGNFQSVMITTNNSLRQKHQNIVTSTTDQPSRTGSNAIHGHVPDSTSSQTPEEQIMENFLDIPVEKVSITMSNIQSQQQPVVTNTGNTSTTQNPNTNMPMMMNPGGPNHGMPLNNPTPGPAPIQNIGITNSALNSSLGLPIGTGNNGIGMQMQGLPSVMQNSQMNNMTNNPIGSSMQSRSIIGGFHNNNGIPVMQGPNVANSLFMNQNNTQQMPPSNELPMSNVNQNPMYPMLGMQHSNSQVPFMSMYGNNMPNNVPSTPNSNNLAEQWFYEDPNKTIQGPFTSRDMYSWYRAGFFNSSLMVRRGCDKFLRPLGSYGPIVPFVHMDIMSPFSMGGFDARPPANHEILNPQPTLGIEDTLWSQPSTSRDLLWMQQPVNARNETGVNTLPMFFWDQQPTSAISSNSLLPEDIAKEMKTEDQILAQLRASQNIATPQPVQFLNDTQTPTSIIKSDDFANAVKATPDLEELQKLIQNESLLASAPTTPDVKAETPDPEVKDKPSKNKMVSSIAEPIKPQPQVQNKVVAETKPTKQVKPDIDKATKNKENNSTKNKNKKIKDEKKEDIVEPKSKDEETKIEKRSAESSPSKNKKEEKPNKKELEREKKEWVKEGFTIVKGPEKSLIKENKKKVEETRVAEEAERKKKEEEKVSAEEEKKKRNIEAAKKPQQEHQQKPLESLIKKAPWSAVATQAVTTSKDGLTLAEIQRLEREKKLEQMKEQQQMMHIIAQQQAAAVAREQEMQAVVGWAKKKSANNTTGQSLAEIQAETKRQSAAAAAAAAAAQAIEDAQVVTVQPVNNVPWGNTHNGGGFWDTQPNPPPKPEKPQEPVKPAEPKTKKKLSVNITTNKKEVSPAVEFDSWCNTVLASWSYKIDVPTFVGFLKDIESPYEVKDYIKCYLDESKESNDFARQFLERRSKLLRVGMVTPSDDLCSPAMAINPRNTSGSDYQEVKGKSKKTKKNKMLKVDARILGFSVTASEDRINVGDIDTV